MSYEMKTLFNTFLAVDTGAKNYVNLVGSTGVVGEYAVTKRVELTRIGVWMKIAAATSTANAVVTFRLRPTFGSATGQTVLGTITVPTGSAIGTIVFKDVTPVVIPVGYTVAMDLTTAGTDASAATGTGVCLVELQPTPEDYRNETNMVVSA